MAGHFQATEDKLASFSDAPTPLLTPTILLALHRLLQEKGEEMAGHFQATEDKLASFSASYNYKLQSL
ncbi:hypothetical protein BDE02_18G125800 [Populus trichocarpa]|nr:hypothetical protein BDE02_18G125800 [Populus trichocarpa]